MRTEIVFPSTPSDRCESQRFEDKRRDMNLASELLTIETCVAPSPVSGFAHVRGYGVYALPFDSGDVLTLRVCPENGFAPYRTI